MAGVLLSVGSAALLFRHLGVADGGRYVTVLALVSIVAGLTDVGLTSIGVRELAVREGDERHRLVRSIIGLRIALTSAGVVGAVAFAAAAGYDSTLVAGDAARRDRAGRAEPAEHPGDRAHGAPAARLGDRAGAHPPGRVRRVGRHLRRRRREPAAVPGHPDPGRPRGAGPHRPPGPARHSREPELRAGRVGRAHARRPALRGGHRGGVDLLPPRHRAPVPGLDGDADRLLRRRLPCRRGARGHPSAAGDRRLSDLLPRGARRPRAPRLRGAAHVGGVHPARRAGGGVAVRSGRRS